MTYHARGTQTAVGTEFPATRMPITVITWRLPNNTYNHRRITGYTLPPVERVPWERRVDIGTEYGIQQPVDQAAPGEPVWIYDLSSCLLNLVRTGYIPPLYGDPLRNCPDGFRH